MFIHFAVRESQSKSIQNLTQNLHFPLIFRQSGTQTLRLVCDVSHLFLGQNG